MRAFAFKMEFQNPFLYPCYEHMQILPIYYTIPKLSKSQLPLHGRRNTKYVVCIVGASANDESAGLWVYLLITVNPWLGIIFSNTGQIYHGSFEIKICLSDSFKFDHFRPYLSHFLPSKTLNLFCWHSHWKLRQISIQFLIKLCKLKLIQC